MTTVVITARHCLVRNSDGLAILEVSVVTTSVRLHPVRRLPSMHLYTLSAYNPNSLSQSTAGGSPLEVLVGEGFFFFVGARFIVEQVVWHARHVFQVSFGERIGHEFGLLKGYWQ